MLYEVFQHYKDEVAPKDAILAPIPQQFGPINLQKLASAPRIIWCPTSDSFEGPVMGDALQILPSGTKVKNRSYRTRNAGVDVYLYHRSYLETEQLINSFLVNAWKTWTACFRIGGGRWLDTGRIEQVTYLYVLPLTIFIPVYEPLPTGTILTIPPASISAPH